MDLEFDLALSIVENQLKRQAEAAAAKPSKTSLEVAEESAIEEDRLRKYRDNYKVFRDTSSLSTLSSAPAASDSIQETQLENPAIPTPVPKPPRLIAANAVETEGSESAKKKPDLGWLTLQLGLKKFEQIDNQLRKATQEVEKEEDKIRQLLNLRKQLTKIPENSKKFDLSTESKELIAALENEGVKLMDKDITSLTQGQFIELKSQIDSCTSQARSKQQTLLTTKINVALTDRSTLLEEMKTILKTNDRLKEFIIEKSARL